jgi:hypothetical protein
MVICSCNSCHLSVLLCVFPNISIKQIGDTDPMLHHVTLCYVLCYDVALHSAVNFIHMIFYFCDNSITTV